MARPKNLTKKHSNDYPPPVGTKAWYRGVWVRVSNRSDKHSPLTVQITEPGCDYGYWIDPVELWTNGVG